VKTTPNESIANKFSKSFSPTSSHIDIKSIYACVLFQMNKIIFWQKTQAWRYSNVWFTTLY